MAISLHYRLFTWIKHRFCLCDNVSESWSSFSFPSSKHVWIIFIFLVVCVHLKTMKHGLWTTANAVKNLLNPVNLNGYREKESEQTAGIQMNFIKNETDFNSLLYKKGQCEWVHRAIWSASKELIPASVALSEWEYFYSSPGRGCKIYRRAFLKLINNSSS